MNSYRRIPYGRQEILQEDIEAVVSCLRGDWLTQGPTVAAFESALQEVTGATYAVAVANGTAALHLAVLGLGLQPGDMGVTSAITFVASANAMRYAGANVTFTDVDAQTGLMSLSSLESTLAQLASQGTPAKLIVPVDLTGQSPDLARVAALAQQYGAKVLQDAAHSLGGSYSAEGQYFRVGEGAHADATILSFHPVKHITTGEGGAILTNDAALYRKLISLRSHGIHKDPAKLTRSIDDPWVGPWYHEQDMLGFNYRITDIQCALGLSQLQRLSAYVKQRQHLAAQYDVALKQSPLNRCLRPLQRLADRHHAYHLYVVQIVPRADESLDSVAARRKHLFEFLKEHGIDPQVHYIPVPWQPYYQDRQVARSASAPQPRGQGSAEDRSGVDCQLNEHRTGGADAGPEAAARWPGAAAYYAASLSLPLYPTLTNPEIERVIQTLNQWAQHDSAA